MNEIRGKKRTAFGRIYHSILGNLIPEYSVFPLMFCFLWNLLIYGGIKMITHDVKHYDFTSNLDNMIPFIPEWVIIYLGCFLFWTINYILIGREGKEKCYRFVFADVLSRCICGVFFALLPTTNIRPTVYGQSLSAQLIRFVYWIDSPVNLFPSIHCLVSWFCYIGIRGSKKVPKWYQIFSLIFAILVCASTQFTKQHYLIDVPSAIIIAEVCFYITNHTNAYQIIKSVFEKIGYMVFGELE